MVHLFNLRLCWVSVAVHGPFPNRGEWALLSNEMRQLLTALLAVEVQLAVGGARAHLPHGSWDLPRPGLGPASPALQADSQPLHHQGSPKTKWI